MIEKKKNKNEESSVNWITSRGAGQVSRCDSVLGPISRKLAGSSAGPPRERVSGRQSTPRTERCVRSVPQSGPKKPPRNEARGAARILNRVDHYLRAYGYGFVRERAT